MLFIGKYSTCEVAATENQEERAVITTMTWEVTRPGQLMTSLLASAMELFVISGSDPVSATKAGYNNTECHLQRLKQWYIWWLWLKQGFLPSNILISNWSNLSGLFALLYLTLNIIIPKQISLRSFKYVSSRIVVQTKIYLPIDSS